MSSSLLRQPLLHFLVLGLLIFLLDARLRGSNETAGEQQSLPGTTITVDEAALLEYMQFQAQTFEPALFEARLRAMSGEERAALAADFIREEALYRESLRLGMDQGDYLIRQRLVQKVEFLLENLGADATMPSEQELQNHYTERSDDYRVPPAYTFTHIFFDARQGGPEQALARAEDLLRNSGNMSVDEAAGQGDRFPFLQQYDGRTRDFVANNFGTDFVLALDQLQPGTGQWQGPLPSRYGHHLVLLESRSESRVPPLAEIRERVLDDYRYEVLLRNRRQAEQRVIAEYDIAWELDQEPEEAR